MRHFGTGDKVTARPDTDPARLRIYYWRYYYNGTYGETHQGNIYTMPLDVVGTVVSEAQSVWEHGTHETFLVIDFAHPATGKIERVALHHSEVQTAKQAQKQANDFAQGLRYVLSR